MLKRISVIEGSYVRDTQVFSAAPIILETDEGDWGEHFIDVKYPCHYIGIFEGTTEDEIKEKAAASEGVHTATITLIQF
jgi:hypothetical protein